MKKFISNLFARKDRFLNVFHVVNLADATSQTLDEELDCLSRHAKGRGNALEIGTRQGVSAVLIVRALRPDAKLFCVDPWSDRKGGMRNPSYDICMRHFRRSGVIHRIVVLRGFSQDMEAQMPTAFDLMFVDGDHSHHGIKTDWGIVRRRLQVGGVVCLHDTSRPKNRPGNTPESCQYFAEVILHDKDFRHLEECHTLNVLQRVA